MKRVGAVVFVVSILAGRLAGQTVPVLDSGFARIKADQPGPAAGIAVSYRGQVVYQNAAGFADLEHRVPATLETRFDWASIAKQFTAFAVSLLVEQGRIDSHDPVRKYLPELDLGGASITVEELIHHTAGLEDSDGLLALAGGQPGDRVSLPALANLVLRQRHLAAAPGERDSYTNSDYVLLAAMVERVTGRNFAAWTDSSIFRPLGMHQTGFLSFPDQLVPNRALPYRPNRHGPGYAQSVDETTPGPGGLYGTVGDLLIWAQHLIEPRYQRAATLRLRTRGRLRSGKELDYAWGLGLGSYRGLSTISHGGSGPASNALLLTFPAEGLAVVTASAGETDPNIAAMAYRAADHVLAGQLQPIDPKPGEPRMLMMTEEMLNARPVESKGIVVEAADIVRYAGTYRLADSTVLVVRTRADQLEFAWEGRRPFIPLFPLADGRFVMVPLWRAYRFLADSTGRVTGLSVEKTPRSLRQRGPDRVLGERLPEIRFDSASAAQYLGLYYSDELGSLYQVALVDGSLELRHPRHGAMRLLPLVGDSFAVDGDHLASLRFGRAGAEVVGLELEAMSWSAKSSFRKLTTAPSG